MLQLILLSIGVNIISIFTTISGIGGGGLLIPYFVILGNYPITKAIPLSICCIFSDCLVRNIYLFNKKINENRYLMDILPSLLIIPGDALTSWIGAYISLYLPSGITLISIISILSFSFFKTIVKGLDTYKKEKNIDIEDLIIIDGIELYLSKSDIIINSTGEKQIDRLKYILIIILNIIIASLFGLLRPKDFNLIFYLFVFGFTFITIISLLLNIVYLKKIYKKRIKQNFNFIEGDFKYDNKMIIKLILSSSITGLLSTYLGIGGGMIINPLLLNLGMNPQVIIASTAITTLFSSLISLINYIIMDQFIFKDGLIYGIQSIIGSIIGIKITSYLLKKYQNQSILIFFTCGVLFVSIISLTINSLLKGVSF